MSLINSVKSKIIQFSKLTLVLGFLIHYPIKQAYSSPNLPICSKYENGKDKKEIRDLLLSKVKENLLTSADVAETHLKRARLCFDNSFIPGCENFKNLVMNSIAENFKMIKVTEALSKDLGAITKLKNKDLIRLINQNKISANKIATFNNAQASSSFLKPGSWGYDYSENDKKTILNVWKMAITQELEKQILDKSANVNSCYDFENASAEAALKNVTKNFRGLTNSIINSNPLLALLDEKSHKDPKAVSEALEKLTLHNHDFSQTIKGFETKHSDSYLSYVFIAIWDHEMGLVNFPQQADHVINQLNETERADACASWSYLESQQFGRVNSSIGVGFSTSVVCGIGLWSGVGTLPALAACTPAMTDSLWGAFVGYRFAKLSYDSGLSGKHLNSGIEFSGGVTPYNQSKKLTSQGAVVSFINLLSLYPIVKGVGSVTKGVKGTAFDLVKIPSVDLSVSFTESKSGVIGLNKLSRWLWLIKGEEAIITNLKNSFPKYESFNAKCLTESYNVIEKANSNQAQ